MCAQYTVKFTENNLIEELDLMIPTTLLNCEQRFLPHSVAPVIIEDKKNLKFTPMKFSLVPAWSAEPRVKFATHNARIESILEKPTWRQPFATNHCVVPLNSFYEAAYTGPLAGNMIKFESEKNNLIFAAGIFDFWKDPVDSNKNFFSFSIVTRDPSHFIVEYGHDRTPIFIKPDFVSEWLNPLGKSSEAIKNELIENAYHPMLKV
ncbi:MAG: SOS response-associated peptidase family protein, partial [Bdellovibrionaceae bacterium]|nr:SOS response-associated peptidase family protein [Pseudobdellovibrionaceae bacterium]